MTRPTIGDALRTRGSEGAAAADEKEPGDDQEDSDRRGEAPADPADKGGSEDTAEGSSEDATENTGEDGSDPTAPGQAINVGDGDIAQGQETDVQDDQDIDNVPDDDSDQGSDIDTGNDGQGGTGDAGGLPVGTSLSPANQIDLPRGRVVGEDGPPEIDPDGGSFQNSPLPGRDAGALGDGYAGMRAPKAETGPGEDGTEFGQGAVSDLTGSLGGFGRGAVSDSPADGGPGGPEADLEPIAGRSLDPDAVDTDQGEPAALGDIFAGLRTAPGHVGVDEKSEPDDGFDVG